MKSPSQLQPLVSIITPLYNNAEHLGECIESVLGQTYSNWNYTIVNNCSTDGSLEVAQKYAARDPRIRVLTNDRFRPIIENHNHAIRQISPDSKYCKFVFADDWLYSSCLEQMVAVAEAHPSVGLVGAYTTDGRAVIWQGPPYPAFRVAGWDICREMLLGGQYVLGTMTSLLIRSDLIRKRPAFFNESNLHADVEACFDVLRESDFGFVHQVLSFSRPRENSSGSFASHFDSIILGCVVLLRKFGPVFLTEEEYRQRWNKLRREYHRILASNVLRMRGRRFWAYHQNTLAAFGCRIDRRLLAAFIVPEVFRQLFRPVHAARSIKLWWLQAASRTSES